jgi:ERCC4-related helicase
MKKVNLKMVGLDGNAFAVLGAFQRQARQDGWSQTEIKEVLDKAMSGDYSNLISTIAEHCVNPI